ncbi:MAG: hypothetical protein AB7I13_21580 [Vicinamibacterales bacterium]
MKTGRETRPGAARRLEFLVPHDGLARYATCTKTTTTGAAEDKAEPLMTPVATPIDTPIDTPIARGAAHPTIAWTTLLVAAFAALATVASAQQPSSSLSAAVAGVTVGQRLWVTDAGGRETAGRFERLSGDGLVLRIPEIRAFGEGEVRRVRVRERDPLKNGTLTGLVVGAGFGTAWCIGAIADDSGEIDARVECAEGYTVFPGLGALIGLAVDAVIPGRLRTIYPSPAASTRSQVTVVPLASRRVKGVALAVTF